MSYFHQIFSQNYVFHMFSLLYKTPTNYYINIVPLKKNSRSCKLPFQSFVLCMLYLYCVYQIIEINMLKPKGKNVEHIYLGVTIYS